MTEQEIQKQQDEKIDEGEAVDDGKAKEFAEEDLGHIYKEKEVFGKQKFKMERFKFFIEKSTGKKVSEVLRCPNKFGADVLFEDGSKVFISEGEKIIY